MNPWRFLVTALYAALTTVLFFGLVKVTKNKVIWLAGVAVLSFTVFYIRYN